MKGKVIVKNAAYYIIGVAAILLLKLYYRTATVDMLQWILLPVSKVVSFITGIAFDKINNVGWVNATEEVVINVTCAGMNFMILTFGTYYFLYIHRINLWYRKWLWLLTCMLLAYVSTLGVNSLRIVLSIYIKNADIYYGWMTYERVHRILGTTIYVLALFLIYYSVGSFFNSKLKKESKFYYPLVGYILIAVIIPIITRAWGDNKVRFCEHTITIVVICVVCSLLVLFIRGFVRKFIGLHHKRKNTSS